MQPQNWFELKGDETLALDWELNENSHIWEIGGFEGRLVQQLWDKFHCHIDVFEPQDWAVAKMKRRFEDIDKIKIHPYGLWTENTEILIGNYHTDGASVITDDGREPKVLGVFKDYRRVYGSIPYVDIDLVIMNIEGAEYTLIPEFFEFGLFNCIRHFFCQFHPKDLTDFRDKLLFEKIGESHDIMWNFYPTAVAWKMKPDLADWIEGME